MSNGPTAIPVSPVNDMVAALNAALASHARLPEVVAQVERADAKITELATHNQRLEENIIGYKNQISELIAKVRSLEVERDDAGFRTLEAEDKLSVLLRDVRNAVSNLDASVVHVDPPKPVPNVAEAAKVDGVKGQSAKDPSNAPAINVSTEASAVSAGNVAETYQPFTPPAPSAKPVEITEGGPAKQDPTNPAAASTQGSVAGPSATGQGFATIPTPDWQDDSRPWRT